MGLSALVRSRRSPVTAPSWIAIRSAMAGESPVSMKTLMPRRARRCTSSCASGRHTGSGAPAIRCRQSRAIYPGRAQHEIAPADARHRAVYLALDALELGVGSASGSAPSSLALSSTAAASGCSLIRSTAAATLRSVSGDEPPAHRTLLTTGFPTVRVPRDAWIRSWPTVTRAAAYRSCQTPLR